VGQRLENDAETRERYLRLARQGRLRCYLLVFENEPIAFARGEISGTVYNYETPGFLPKHHKYSPGLVLMAHAIADLIENTDCTLFDFGSGGDMTGDKSRFGTKSEPSRNLSFVNGARARGLVIWLAGTTLAGIKAAARAVLGEGELKRRVKKAIRRYGSSDDLVQD
jgi:CelD/BcsL family acetyltransferase involved in cellulose biosynthesis